MRDVNSNGRNGMSRHTLAVQTERKPRRKHSRITAALCGTMTACFLFAIQPPLDAAAANTAQLPTTSSIRQNSLPLTGLAANTGADTYDLGDGLPGEEVYKKVSPSVVSVISTTSSGTGSGSGVIMSADGYIITNNHVVSDAQEVVVQLSDGSRFPAEIVGLDEQTDLAVLKIQPTTALTAAEFGDSDKLQPGEYAYTIGSPGGVELANTITGGRISAINRDVTIDDRVMTLIQTDASINPGNSGGALINKYGQVVGITSAKISNSSFGSVTYEGLGFAIPINTAQSIADELIANGYIAGRPSIGITGQNLSVNRATTSNLPQGVYILSVDERAKAYSEGLMAGDIITAVDGQNVTTMDEINEVKQTKTAGDKISLRVYRTSTGQYMDLSITLTDEHDLSNDTQTTQQSSNGGYYPYYRNPFFNFFGW